MDTKEDYSIHCLNRMIKVAKHISEGDVISVTCRNTAEQTVTMNLAL